MRTYIMPSAIRGLTSCKSAYVKQANQGCRHDPEGLIDHNECPISNPPTRVQPHVGQWELDKHMATGIPSKHSDYAIICSSAHIEGKQTQIQWAGEAINELIPATLTTGAHSGPIQGQLATTKAFHPRSAHSTIRSSINGQQHNWRHAPPPLLQMPACVYT